VATAAHSKQEAVLTRELNSADDVRGTFAADDRARVAVDHRVPNRACLIVACFTREANIATQRFAESS
jgi:hypothetical protein